MWGYMDLYKGRHVKIIMRAWKLSNMNMTNIRLSFWILVQAQPVDHKIATIIADKCRSLLLAICDHNRAPIISRPIVFHQVTVLCRIHTYETLRLTCFVDLRQNTGFSVKVNDSIHIHISSWWIIDKLRVNSELFGSATVTCHRILMMYNDIMDMPIWRRV